MTVKDDKPYKEVSGNSTPYKEVSVKTPIDDLCDDALNHYYELSDNACHYNSLIPKALEVYRRVQEYYDELNTWWNSLTWQKGFDPYTASELNQLEEFLGIDIIDEFEYKWRKHDSSISTKIPPLCDMLDTDLCKHYQTKNECHYKETHYVRCVINKFTGTALGDSLPRKVKECK